ncbi:EsV-1-7 [Ectocarpus siliculosus]|uniref:EsV-1-7 n=1 Tax=Ectocarpus siliculosus TaxID=2880 RepID=D7G4B5_ECTSI|nr:EsV-1-7 [Ectocarpus siliculosus]|eukprot:CBJ27130.1 EsV-1-7 [Ectocarpus siliculosus]
MHRLFRGAEESSEVDGNVKEEMWTDGIRGAETRKGEQALGGSPLGESCPLDGCTRKPTHGVKGKKAVFCVSHIIAGSVNVTKECTADGCFTGAKFGVAGSKKEKFCSKHAPSGVVNLAVTSCATEGCFMDMVQQAARRNPARCIQRRGWST